MKIVLVAFLQIMILVFLVSQVIIPAFTKLPFFWVFGTKKDKSFSVNDLNDLESHVNEKAESYKEAFKHVEETEKRIKQIKEKAKV